MFRWFKRRPAPTPPAPPSSPEPSSPRPFVQGSANASLLLGVAAAAAGRFTEALAYFDRMVALAPVDPDGHAYRGQVLAVLKRHDEALQAFAEALRLDPHHGHALLERGLVYQDLGQLKAAYADYTLVVEQARDQTHQIKARYNRALLDEQAGDLERAEQEYQTILEVAPGYPPAANSLAAICLKRGLTGRDARWLHMAVNILNRALAAQPDDLICRMTRGQALAVVGAYTAARTDLEAALQSTNPAVRKRAQEVLATIPKG